MIEPRLVQGYAVQLSGLYVFILIGCVIRTDLERIAVTHIHFHVGKHRATDIIGRRTRSHRIESHLAENNESGHTTTVLIARHTHQIIAEPLIQ